MTDKVSVSNVWDDARLRGFLGGINRRCGIVETLALPTMRDLPPAKIETLFVPPFLSNEAVSADSDPAEWPEGKNLLEELDKAARLVVLGDPGGGKTTLSNWVAWRLTSGLAAPLPSRLLNIIPIPCVLREVPRDHLRDSKSIFELASYVARKILGDERAIDVIPVLKDWISVGKFILILDGIDEIPIESRSSVAGWIKEAKEKKACVLATSRIVGYDDYPVDSPVKESQLRSDIMHKVNRRKNVVINEAVIPEESESLNSSWAEIRYLMPFDKNQIADFVRNWYRQRCASDNEAKGKTLDLLGALKDSEVTSNLARTPNLLSLMAIVHRERAHLPDGKALLYEEIVNAYLNTIDSQRKIIQDDILGNYTWRDKKAWISYVGYMMQSARTDYTQEGILASEKQVVLWLVKAMRQSGVINAETVAVEFLAWVARRSGLLLPRGEGYYAFVHLSFQEYFCACYLEASVVSPEFFNKRPSSKSNVSPAHLKGWANESHWLETLIFVFEILSNERNVSWISSLVESIYPDFPNATPTYGALERLAARLLTNKHVRLNQAWVDYLADLSSVMVYNSWSQQPSSNTMASFIALGYAVAVESDEAFSSAMELLSSKKALDRSKVRILIFNTNEALDSEFLSGFTRLFVLSCDGCESVDIAGLPKKYVSVLSVRNSSLKGGCRINDFKRLNTLHLYGVRQEGMELAKGSSNIEDALLCNMNLSSLDFLSGWKKIVSLDITGVDIFDVSVIRSFKALEHLTLEQLPVEDMGFLASLRHLQYLSLSNCPVSEIPRLKVDVPLSVGFRGLKIKDLDCLSNVRYFAGGVIADCPVTSLSGLPSAYMSYLYLDRLPLLNFDGIGEYSNVSSLVIRNIQCDDFSPLSKLKGLRSLRVYSTPVKDLKWIKGMRGVNHVLLSDTLIRDLSPLKSLKNLREVTLNSADGLNVSDLASNPKISVSVIDKEHIR